MSGILEALKPRKQRRIIDLVEEAGIDVSPWSKRKDGSATSTPEKNPHYCYEWAFGGGEMEPRLFCIWHRALRANSHSGSIECADNLRNYTRELELVASDPRKPQKSRNRARDQARRADRFDRLAQEAFFQKSLIRVVLLDGTQNEDAEVGEGRSSVTARLLDPEQWHVADYDYSTGAVLFVRGATGEGGADRSTAEAFQGQAQPTRAASSSAGDKESLVASTQSTFPAVLSGKCYVTRVAYNEAEWRQPSKRARPEAAGSYTKEFGFGHEDWLFRDEWTLDGWRYSFLQGVNKSYDRLWRLAEPFAVALFTIVPLSSGKTERRYVAWIDEVECLSPKVAGAALDAFRERGWYATMMSEIDLVGGNKEAFGNIKYAYHALNIRFRQERLHKLAGRPLMAADDPAMRHKHIVLSEIPCIPPFDAEVYGAGGSDSLPLVGSHVRRFEAREQVCTPEHTMIQRALMIDLRVEFPTAEYIRREVAGVDVVLKLGNEIVLYEIKSELRPLSVIRNALGQLLEYAFARTWTEGCRLRLVIVGRRKPDQRAQDYLTLLRERFKLPVEYRVVSIDD